MVFIFALMFSVVVLIGCAFAVYVVQQRKALRMQSAFNDQTLSRIAAIERWAGPFAEFSGDMNKRLIFLETDNVDLSKKPERDDEDPFTGSRSWTAQAAAAERGAGVRLSA